MRGSFNSDGFELDIDAMFEEAAQNPAQTQRDSWELEKIDDDNAKSQVPDESGICGQNRDKSLYDNDLQVHPRGVEPLGIRLLPISAGRYLQMIAWKPLYS